MSVGRLAVQMLCALVCAGCYGRAIVGERAVDNDATQTQKAKADCQESVSMTLEDLPPATRLFDLSSCRMDSDATCPDASRCGVGQGAWELSSMKCLTARAEHTDEDADEPLQASDITLEQVNLTLSSRTPAEVDVSRAGLQQVSFALLGRLTLRVTDSTVVDQVSFTAPGDATIELAGGEASQASFKASSGTVSLRNLTLRGVYIEAKRIELDGSTVSDAVLIAEELNTQGATLERTLVSAMHARLATTALVDSELSECVAAGSLQAAVQRADAGAQD